MAKTGGNQARLGFVGERVGYLLHRTDILHMQLIREELTSLGLTPARATALAYVHENAGCRQNDLAQALGINRSSAMEVVNSLVALDAMERQAAPDKRTNALFLTSKGLQLFAQFSAISKEVDEVITASLSPAERDMLVELFTRISGSLNQALVPATRKSRKSNITQ